MLIQLMVLLFALNPMPAGARYAFAQAESARIQATYEHEMAARAEAERIRLVSLSEREAEAVVLRRSALTETRYDAAPAAPPPRAVPTSYTASVIAEAAILAGWPASLAPKVERVAMCESGGLTSAVAPAGYVGLMQVAPWLHGAVPEDAVGQLAQALAVYHAQGWGAWPVCGQK